MSAVMKRNLLLVIPLLLLMSCNEVDKGEENNMQELSTSKENSIENSTENSIVSSQESNEKEDTIHFELDKLGDNVMIHTDLQEQYLKDSNFKDTSAYVDAKSENSRSQIITLNFKVEGNVGDIYTLYLSENEDMRSPLIKESKEQKFEIKNLKIHTRYYWQIKVDNKLSKIATFKTSDTSIRNLNIDSIPNVRDIGGLNTTNGSTIKQGLVYRSYALTYNNSGARIISDKGIEELRELGIKSEIDLRGASENENGGITKSVLGDDVKYYHCPMGYYNLLVSNKEQVAKVFEIIANPDNLPTIIHCAGGTDRTGMIAYLLNSLLSVTEEDLGRDYMFSNFYHSNDPRVYTNLTSGDFFSMVANADGKNQMSRTYNTLVSQGVNSEDLDAIIDYFLEK